VSVEETLSHFENGMYLGFSGFAEGNPKLLPDALAAHVKSSGLSGKMKFNVYTGASIGPEVDELWSSLGMIERRWPYQQGAAIRAAINNGENSFGDRHLSMYAAARKYAG
jgi:acetyl-CoA hydrolase